MPSARLLMAGAVVAALVTACLAQAASLPLPWCSGTDVLQTATSADLHWILATDSSQQSLTLYDDAANPARHYPLTGLEGGPRGTALAIVDAPPRNSFIVVLRDVPEVWEISYDPNADPIFDGLVHDYRMGEGLSRSGFLGVRRTLLRAPLTAPYFTADYSTVIGTSSRADTGGAQARIVNLDVRREIATATLATLPEPGAPLAVATDGRTWHASRNLLPASESVQRLVRYCTP